MSGILWSGRAFSALAGDSLPTFCFGTCLWGVSRRLLVGAKMGRGAIIKLSDGAEKYEARKR